MRCSTCSAWFLALALSVIAASCADGAPASEAPPASTPCALRFKPDADFAVGCDPEAAPVCLYETACRDACRLGESRWGNPDAMEVCVDLGVTLADCVQECCTATKTLAAGCADCIDVAWSGGCGGPDGDDAGFEECTCEATVAGVQGTAECARCQP